MSPNNQKKLENEQQVILTDNSRQLPAQFFKKSHDLLFSQLSLSPREHDIMALLLSRLHQEHWQSFIDGTAIRAPAYQFKSDVLCEWLGVSSSNLYNTLSGPAESLANRAIGIRQPDRKEFDFVSLFKRLSYKDAVLTIIPNDELMKEYLGVSQGHAQVDHHVFRKLKKEHSKRLYPLLSRFKNEAHTLHPQSIEELHGFFGLLNEKGELIKTSYANNKVFIDRCIRQPIEEIAKHDPNIEFQISPEGTFGYRTMKSGRKIAKVEFLYRWRKPVNKEEQAERAKLAQEKAPIEHAEMVYDLVMDFVPGQSGNPTVEELNGMMMHSAKLIEQGRALDAAFMAKFSAAMSEAIAATGSH
ncbi:RepB family plasmid replication initiator protein [Grimontia hollisae]|nr:RepB family plasmid replication initiator protein [Grimontia hollisae]STO79480.1 Protein involved in initiation of plasmid replication [Grimontia hollisae]STO98974.1 Protein involved in initiation of plasmid replication [Grimontia hollisae]STR61850.1 Protein involved in initiation of plasmid replication [Grimontia hollisae]